MRFECTVMVRASYWTCVYMYANTQIQFFKVRICPNDFTCIKVNFKSLHYAVTHFLFIKGDQSIFILKNKVEPNEKK